MRRPLVFNKKIWNLAKGSRKWIILTSIVLFVKGLLNIIQVIFISLFFYKASEGELNKESIIYLTIALGIVTIFKSLASFAESRFAANAASFIKTSIRQEIFAKIKRLGPGYLDQAGTGEVSANTVDGVEAMEIYYSRFVLQLFYSLTIPLVLFALVATIDITCAVILLAAVPIIPASMVFISKWAKKSMGNFWKGYQNLSSVFLDNLQGMVTLKLFNKSGKRLEEMESQSWSFRNATMNLLKMQLTSITIMDTLVYGFAAAGISLAIFKFYSGAIQLNEAVILLLLSVEFFLPIRRLGSYFHAGVNGIQAGNKISQFLEAEEILDPKDPKPFPANSTLTVKEISYHYPAAPERNILSRCNVTFESGKIYAIQGASGSGKSTLGRLLMRFHEPQSGEITVGDIPLWQLSLTELRKKITLIESKSMIFSGTIESNLKMAKPNATTKEMIAVCNRFGLGEFIGSDKAGLKKETGERGNKLSEGEKQRLALARSLLMDTPILILDEVTASVDAKSEDKILEAIQSLKGEKTVIIITHRDTMLKCADEIFTLEKEKLKPQKKSNQKKGAKTNGSKK